MGTVKVDARFWKIARNDYADWVKALPRELAQNSLDAGATKIEVDLVPLDGDRTEITWRDNGRGIDNPQKHLLRLGSSGKEFEGTTGGFGIAKTLILFSQESYEVRSKTFTLKGVGGDYTLTYGEYYNGTEIKIVSDCTMFSFRYNLKQWINKSRIKVPFIINGEEYVSNLTFEKDTIAFKFGTLYKCIGDISQSLIVGINGQMMFENYITPKVGLFLDLNKTAQECLQTNRDGLSCPYNDVVLSFVRDAFGDNDTDVDLKMYRKPLRIYYGWSPERASKPQEKHAYTDHLVSTGKSNNDPVDQYLESDFAYTIQTIYKEYTIDFEFLKKLDNMILILKDLFKIQDKTIPGLVYNNKFDGLCESYEGVHVIYMNPTVKRSFNEMLLVCVHELAHIKCSQHYESWMMLHHEYVVKILDNLETLKGLLDV